MRDALSDESDDEPFELWRENERAFALFLACRRQWALAPMGGYFGLRAEGVEAVLRMKRVPGNQRDALFDELQIMAEAALPILNAQDEA